MNDPVFTMNFGNDRVDSLVLGRSFIKNDLREHLLKSFATNTYRDAVQVILEQGELWTFDYGVLVFWGTDQKTLERLVEQLAVFVEERYGQGEHEHVQFLIGGGQVLRIHNDLITLPNSDVLSRLAVSHALAQSAKLGYFEYLAQRVISDNAYLAKTLAKTGRIPLTRRRLAMLRGSLFETTSDISLHFNLLDTPEFFWNYPEVEPIYHAVAKYLDLTPRIELLNHKLSIIHELVDMLASEQNHKHSAFLEWVIIVLIAVDILVYLF